MHKRVRYLALMVFTGLVSCGPDGPVSPGHYDGPMNSCQRDADCPEGGARSFCDIENGHCVTTESDEKRYLLKATPLLATGVSAQVFPVALNTNGELVIPGDEFGEPEAPPTLRGTQNVILQIVVPKVGGLPAPRFDVKVVFIHEGLSIPGEPARTKSYVISSRTSNFKMEILPGLYRIKVIPQGDNAAEYPPKHWEHVTVSATGGLFIDVDGGIRPLTELVLPRAQTVVSGIIRRGGQMLAGLSVEARDADTGWVVSTRASVACPGGIGSALCGWFSLGLLPGVTRFSLEVFRAGEPWFPKVTVPGFVIGDGVDSVDLGFLNLEPVGAPVKYHARVERTLVLPNGNIVHDGVPDCLVVFRSDDVAGGEVAVEFLTDESGALEDAFGRVGVDLFPATYDLTVVPPAPFRENDPDYAVFHWDKPVNISGSAEIEGQVFTLSKRHRIEGRLWGSNGWFSGVTVVAQPLAGETSHPRTSFAITQNDGSYSIWVDGGAYRLTSMVSPESFFSWGTSDIRVNENTIIDPTVTIPVVSKLSLQQAGGVGLGGVAIDVYEEEDGSAFLVGQAITNSSGEATVLLPSSLTD